MKYLDRILKKAEKEHDLLKHPYVGTEHLLLALLSEENELTNKLKEYKLTYNKFKRKLKEIIGEGSNKSPYILYTPMLRKVIENATNENEDVNSKSLFQALLEPNEGIAIRIIETMGINVKDLDLDNNNVLKISSTPIAHRDKEINEILQILLRKNKCNPLLIGDAGVGKTAIVEEIQRRLLNGEVPENLKEYKIINIDISSLVAGTKYRGDFETKINDLLKSVKNSKKILFIDEIHTLVHAGGAEGAISAGDIIKPYLARGLVKCIGATTINEYHEYFECDEALNRRFQTVLINEPSKKYTVDILNTIKESYENFHKLKIENELIDEIVNISNKYLTNKKNPDKSIELLDSCCTNALFNEQNKVMINNLYNVLESRFGINLSNNYIKEIISNKSIVLTTKDNIDKLNNLSCNLLYLDGNKFKTDDDLYNLLGNPLYKNNYYLLKSIIDYPLGIITITNCNYNEILKEFIHKLINTRHIIDNYGNNINFENYIIIMEKNDVDERLGFTNSTNNNVSFIELDEKILLTAS